MSGKPDDYPPGYNSRFYLMEYVCRNCGHKDLVEIDRGVEAPALSNEVCSNCGCKTLWKKLGS